MTDIAPQYLTTSDGINIAYWVRGKGTPVLCLHGLSRNSRDFDCILPHLDGFRVITMDYRGRGESQYDPNFANYNLIREATDAVELLDFLGIERAALIGTSRGGLISMGLANTQKHRVRGILLNDIGPELMPEGLENIMNFLGKEPPWKTLDEAAKGLPEVSVGFAHVPENRWRTIAGHRWKQDKDGLILNYDPNLRLALEETSHLEVPDMWPFFDAMADLPLALVRGANSDLLSSDTAAEMRKRRPDMIFADVPDRGHHPFLDEPESLKVLDQFLKVIK